MLSLSIRIRACDAGFGIVSQLNKQVKPVTSKRTGQIIRDAFIKIKSLNVA